VLVVPSQPKFKKGDIFASVPYKCAGSLNATEYIKIKCKLYIQND